jgi:ferredoxin--NADP+ reductase
MLGRRGPAEAAFTNPELRELGELSRADVIVDAGDLEAIDIPQDTTRRRNVEILRDYASRSPSGRSHRVVLRFLRSPVEILGDAQGRVRGVRVAVNRLVDGRPVATGEEEVIECGLVLRAIGYRGEPLPGLPFDQRRGLVANADGRVVGEDGSPRIGEYVAGWIKRGPSGVIGTNKKCAAGTVAKVVEDRDAGRLNAPGIDGDVHEWLEQRVSHLTTWERWLAIDERERSAGEACGRPRVKFVRLADMQDLACT